MKTAPMNIVFVVDANIICQNFVDVHGSPVLDIAGDISIDMFNCHRHMAFTYGAIIYQTKNDHGDSFINIKIKKYDFENNIEDLILKLEEHQFSSYEQEICDWSIPLSAILDEMKCEAEDKLIVWISHRNAYWWKKIETNSDEKMKERYEKMEYLIKQLIDRNFLFLGIDIRIQVDDGCQETFNRMSSEFYKQSAGKIIDYVEKISIKKDSEEEDHHLKMIIGPSNSPSMRIRKCIHRLIYHES